MFNENEVAMLLLCCGIFIFIISKRRSYQRIPHCGLLLSSFCLFFAAVIFTVAEHFFLPTLFNILEHLLYLFSSLVILLWCWVTFSYDKRGE